MIIGEILRNPAEKVHKEKAQPDKLKEVKARLNFERCSGRNSKIQEASQHSESITPNIREEHTEGDEGSDVPAEGKGRRERDIFNRLECKTKSVSVHSKSRYQSSRLGRTKSVPSKHHHEGTYSRRTEMLSESKDSEGGHWKSRFKKKKSSIEEDDLSQPWVCEETYPFTSRIRYFDFSKKTWMPSNVKTYDRSEDPKDHLKIFQAAAKVKRWAMPTWCHMFNSTLTGSAKVRHVKEASKCMRISGFMHEITNPELIKCLHDKILKLMDKMMRITTSFLRGDLRNQQKSERRRNRFTLITKSPREILTLDRGKFKVPPPTTTPLENINNNKFCEFHVEVRHNTDECMHLKRKIEELIKAGKLSRVIKELKQGNEKDKSRAAKKGETPRKEKALAILMVQPWKKVARQRITQSFSPDLEMSFSPLAYEDETEGPMIIEAEIGGRSIHRMGCEIFNFYMDELYGGKITISIQWDHRKAMSKEIQAVLSTAHGMLKFPIPSGILTLRCSRIIPLKCTMVLGPDPQPFASTRVAKEKSADMTGVPQHIVEHQLNIRDGCAPIRQKKRSQAPERNNTIQEEVERLMEAGIMKEVHYHSWLANPVMNAGVNYQSLVDKAFQKQISRNLKVYVDDLVIKSRTKQEIIRDIKETFKTLREINMKLNHKKCTFGVEEGMFLGYKKCTKKSDFQWTAEAEAAFKQMKKLIVKLPTLTAPMEKEELIMYPAVAREAVSAVLMTEKEVKQTPIYFVNHALQDFIVERPKDDSLAATMEVEEKLSDPWTLFTDISSCMVDSRAGLILTD
uniref:Reverse transcriptase domain-containing protein n=1 Tax=Tanacetum cinerariifolium TaxID=118510 RepID=A0A699HXA9_TANCI|nr:hypothetical protein [Tanacetum cinerariifolium]